MVIGLPYSSNPTVITLTSLSLIVIGSLVVITIAGTPETLVHDETTTAAEEKEEDDNTEMIIDYGRLR